MSHFTVLVVGNDVEGQLAPFNEQPGENEKDYLEFEEMEDEYRDQYENQSTEQIVIEGIYFHKYAEDVQNFAKERLTEEEQIEIEKDSYWASHVVNRAVNRLIEEGALEVAQVPFKELYLCFEDFVKGWQGESERDEYTGRFGYWHNPNAKWDWYQIGGRWSGFFKLKNGAEGELGKKSWMIKDEEIPEDRADQALKGDIDWEGMKEANRSHAEESWEEIQKIIAETDARHNWCAEFERLVTQDKVEYDRFVGMCDHEGYSKNPDTYRKWVVNGSLMWRFSYNMFKPLSRDEYIAVNTIPSTYAVLKDGEWYQHGEMGWWGLATDEKDENTWVLEFDKLLQGVSDDTLLTVVDCHI